MVLDSRRQADSFEGYAVDESRKGENTGFGIGVGYAGLGDKPAVPVANLEAFDLAEQLVLW